MVWDKRLREKVRKIRSRGKTYLEIKNSLGINVPKSTLSDWCTDVVLPDWYIDRIDKLNDKNLSNGRKIALISNKLKQEKLLEYIYQKNLYIKKKLKDKTLLKLLLAILYLGEGSKWKSHRGLVLGSSDPNIIKLYTRLLAACYGIKASDLKCRVSYRADQNIRSLEKHWSKVTKIPLNNFYKTIPDPRTLGKKTKNKDYKGVCVIYCKGTNIQLELEMIPKIILEGPVAQMV